MAKKTTSKAKKTPFSIGYILIFLAVMYVVQMFLSPKAEELSYSQFRLYLKNGYISDCTVGSNLIRGHYKKVSAEGDKEEKVAFATVPIQDMELVNELESQKVRFKGAVENNFLKNVLMWWVFPFGIMALGWFFLFRKVGGMGSPFMSFGKAKIKLYSDNGTQKTTFIDVAGCDEAKEELKEIIDFLSYPERFQKLGGKIPKGVLLIGPPGTGKTLLARAVAGEAGVPFFSISGSDFVEMFVGMGAARVRDMFEQAKEKAPCIVFIDEIDSVGRQRGTGLGGGHDEREQTLNQLLAEMDGFNSQKGVIIVAATNRPDVLDSALLRPGRFDRQITVDRPDLIGREAVLAVHAKSVKLASDVSLKVIAKRTPGFSGADLANVINEAALLAARHDKNFVGMEELESSIDRVIAGPERKSRIMSDVEKKTVAFHESGHTLVAALLPNTDPVHKVSIIPRGTAALGYTMQLPMEDKYLTSESEILDTLCVLLGGRAAEELVLHEISTGAQNDLEKASHLARNYVCRFGMSKKLGPQTFGRQSGNIFLGHDLVQEKEYSDKTAIIIDEEVTDIIMRGYEKTKKLLNNNKDKLELLAKKLEEEEVLEGEQVLELLSIEKKRPRIHKEVDIAPVEQPQQNLQFINKETDKK
ncbi:MAG: ATP-dependent metallopeptidase FtsH/Yme1/Tma family protein [Planctomycetes bacterium]|uniref:ATP-dependent zinc metalloprotease FtsH n=1 Tax=Candidatus Wunengus californicus TaxID=3367619 RepID=UPI00402811AD|nr:ATP-dependent metallopeptidase FtsH/Yme1/Tma family protein [Planctomycetota bacterium]